MTKTQPWTFDVERKDSPFATVKDECGRAIGRVAKGDAALIAAAPDMLDALGEAFAVLDSFVNGQGAVTLEEIEAAHLSIHNALNKAQSRG